MAGVPSMAVTSMLVLVPSARVALWGPSAAAAGVPPGPRRVLAMGVMAPEPEPTEPWADVSAGFGPENLDRPWEDGHYDHRWRVRWLCDPWVLRQEIET